MGYLDKKAVADIFSTYAGDAKNTGSVEGQVALFTERIKHLSAHLEKNRKDFSTQRGLHKLVGKRKKLLAYLRSRHLERYRTLIAQLGLRR